MSNQLPKLTPVEIIEWVTSVEEIYSVNSLRTLPKDASLEQIEAAFNSDRSTLMGIGEDLMEKARWDAWEGYKRRLEYESEEEPEGLEQNHMTGRSLDIKEPVEKWAKRKIKCMWCNEPIERENDYIVREIQTDKGEMKGNLHLGCSTAIDESPVELLRAGWVKGSNACGRSLGK